MGLRNVFLAARMPSQLAVLRTEELGLPVTAHPWLAGLGTSWIES